MADRGYAQIADEQVMSRARFRAHAPRSVAGNILQLAGRRGNVVAAERYLARPIISGATVELARFYFDSTPLEDSYWISPVVSFWPNAYSSFVFNWYVTTESASGGHVSADPIVSTHTIRAGLGDISGMGTQRDRYAIVTGDSLPLSWPLDQNAVLNERSLGWSLHLPSSALPTQGRVLSLWMRCFMSSGIGTVAAADQILLRGVTCYGVQR